MFLVLKYIEVGGETVRKVVVGCHVTRPYVGWCQYVVRRSSRDSWSLCDVIDDEVFTC